MKKLAIIILVIIGSTVASCNPTKTNINTEETVSMPEIEFTDSTQVNGLLERLEMEIYMLRMVNHDVMTNGDAIIHAQETISGIIKQIEEHSEILNEAQSERFQGLRQLYKDETGE